MKKEIFMNKLKNMKLVAHRLGYQMTPYPENSFESLKYIFKNKELLDSCFGFEFDICFTKDHIPIVVHDKYIDDISDDCGLIKDKTLKSLKKLSFNFRKSKKNNKNQAYKIITLEELLIFFQDNGELLGNKIIKIETKDYLFINKRNFRKTNLTYLAEILNKYPKLTPNIVHLSYWPLNLIYLKKIQKRNNYNITRSDLLCDQGLIIFVSRFISSLDNISLRIKDWNIPKVSKNYSKRVNRKIKLDRFFMKFSNTIKEKNLKYAISKYGTVGLYTLNTKDELNEICRNISNDFIKNNFRKIIITTNNPLILKKKRLF